jgi:predicted DNA-binding protein with PD1-like motif
MKHVRRGPVHLLRLERGERLVETLTAFCRDRKIGAASFQGIGTCRRAELGYFRTARKRYSVRVFRGEYEIIALQGNVSIFEGKPFIHAHIVISGPDFLARGGHLREAEVRATCEVVLLPLPGHVGRTFERASGLSLLEFRAGPSRR